MLYTAADILPVIIGKSVDSSSALIILDYLETKEENVRIFVSDNGKRGEFLTQDEKILNFRKDIENYEGKFEFEAGNADGNSIYIEINKPVHCAEFGKNIAELFSRLIMTEGDFELIINRAYGEKKYTVVRSEIKVKPDITGYILGLEDKLLKE